MDYASGSPRFEKDTRRKLSSKKCERDFGGVAKEAILPCYLAKSQDCVYYFRKKATYTATSAMALNLVARPYRRLLFIAIILYLVPAFMICLHWRQILALARRPNKVGCQTMKLTVRKIYSVSESTIRNSDSYNRRRRSLSFFAACYCLF
jgi:hypothetical protein